MLSAGLCFLQSYLFPKSALEPVLCSNSFNSVVLLSMVTLFASPKESEREGVSSVCFDESFGVFLKVKYML